MLSQKMTLKTDPTQPVENEPVEISRLINSIHYFIDVVFIAVKSGYRLIALQNGAVLNDNVYKTLRGARIAFSRFYQEKSWREDVRAQWTPLYTPYRDWLEEKMKHLEKSH